MPTPRNIAYPVDTVHPSIPGLPSLISEFNVSEEYPLYHPLPLPHDLQEGLDQDVGIVSIRTYLMCINLLITEQEIDFAKCKGKCSLGGRKRRKRSRNVMVASNSSSVQLYPIPMRATSGL